jgi:branched-chain amino acid transport system permease protein
MISGDGRMTEQLVFMLQLLITGVAVGSVYALMALGFVLIFKASSVVNFGPGELVLFGAYVSWATILQMHLPLYVALPLTLVTSVALGLIIERGVLRPLIGEPLISVIMVTFGFASVIRGVLNMVWGSDTRPFPALFSSEPFHLGPVPVSPVHLWSFVMVVILLAAFSVFFKYSLTGMAMRATADNQQVALSLGVSVKGIFALSWCIATVVSTLGGIILGSVRGGVDFSLAELGLKVFPVVILGGLDSVMGAIVGGVLIGVFENLSGGYLDPIFGGGVKEVAPFAILVLILMLRPYGLFGKVEIERV